MCVRVSSSCLVLLPRTDGLPECSLTKTYILISSFLFRPQGIHFPLAPTKLLTQRIYLCVHVDYFFLFLLESSSSLTMVYTGKPSRGCQTCKKRRIKVCYDKPRREHNAACLATPSWGFISSVLSNVFC